MFFITTETFNNPRRTPLLVSQNGRTKFRSLRIGHKKLSEGWVILTPISIQQAAKCVSQGRFSSLLCSPVTPVMLFLKIDVQESEA